MFKMTTQGAAKKINAVPCSGGWHETKLFGRVCFVHRVSDEFAAQTGVNPVWVRVGSVDMLAASAEFRGTAEAVAAKLAAL